MSLRIVIPSSISTMIQQARDHALAPLCIAPTDAVL
jgi:hypothetical protein